MAAYTTIDNPELYFQTKLYSGDGSTDVSHTFDGSEDMQANLIWFKRRNGSANHFLYDSVREQTDHLFLMIQMLKLHVENKLHFFQVLIVMVLHLVMIQIM